MAVSPQGGPVMLACMSAGHCLHQALPALDLRSLLVPGIGVADAHESLIMPGKDYDYQAKGGNVILLPSEA